MVKREGGFGEAVRKSEGSGRACRGFWPESVGVPVGVMAGREMICEGLRMKSGFNLIQPGWIKHWSLHLNTVQFGKKNFPDITQYPVHKET